MKDMHYEPDTIGVQSELITRDGCRLKTRLIQPSDSELLIDLFEQLSSESRRRRFHLSVDNVSEDLKQRTAGEFANVDNRTQGGAVLAVDINGNGTEQIVGVARLARPAGHPNSPEAETAVVIRDDFQGRSVGIELLRRLVRLAQQMQIKTLIAIIEADNEPALKLFRKLELPTVTHVSRAEIEMRMTIPG
jgi:acetyltransferase